MHAKNRLTVVAGLMLAGGFMAMALPARAVDTFGSDEKYRPRLFARFGGDFPKGAAPHVRTAAEALVRAHGPAVMLETAKCHFRTLDQVLAATGHSRADLPPEGRVLSVPPSAFRRQPPAAP